MFFLNNLKQNIIKNRLKQNELKMIKIKYFREYNKLILGYSIYKSSFKNSNIINLNNINLNLSVIFLFRYLRNNIIGMITSESGKIITSISAGRLGYKGKKKISVIAAKNIGK